MKPLIAIVGNTGAGKSQFAVELAKALNGEIINGDAMQMYQGLDIITNKHPEPEREGIPHHLLGFEPWDSQLTVQDFEKQATNITESIHDRGKLPILVGGTHYYIQSLIATNSLIATKTEDSSAQCDGEMKFTEEQLRVLEDPRQVESLLKEVDPVISAKFHPNDTRRLRRALEIWFETGRKPSEIYETQASGGEAERQKLRYRVLVFWVWCNRQVLVDRLDTRVLSMVDSGLMKEIESLYGRYSEEKSNTGIWQVLGFRQFLPYLQDPSPENWKTGLTSMQAETRQYSKKQSKWIKNKLHPLIDSLGGEFALLDSSDLANWDAMVKERGISIASQWLNGDASATHEPLIPETHKDEVFRKRQMYNKTQWVRYRCDECSAHRQIEVVLMGDDEWEVHTKSKAHRAIIRKACQPRREGSTE